MLGEREEATPPLHAHRSYPQLEDQPPPNCSLVTTGLFCPTVTRTRDRRCGGPAGDKQENEEYVWRNESARARIPFGVFCSCTRR